MSKLAAAGAYGAGFLSGLAAAGALVAYLEPDVAERIGDVLAGYLEHDEPEPMIAS